MSIDNNNFLVAGLHIWQKKIAALEAQLADAVRKRDEARGLLGEFIDYDNTYKLPRNSLRLADLMNKARALLSANPTKDVKHD